MALIDGLGHLVKAPLHALCSEIERRFKHYGQRDFLVMRGDKVHLTPEGEQVVAWAERVLQEYDQGIELPVQRRQEIFVAAAGRVLTFLLPRVVEEFFRSAGKRKKYDLAQGIDIRFREGDAVRVLRDLRNGEPHIAVCSLPNEGIWDDLDSELVWDDIPTVMIAARKHPTWGEARRSKGNRVRLSELAAEAVCVFAPDLHDDPLRSLPRPTAAGSRILVERYASIVALVQAGGCVGFVPLCDRNERSSMEEQGILVYDIADAAATRARSIYLWQRRAEPLPEAVKLLVEVLRKQAGRRATRPE